MSKQLNMKSMDNGKLLKKKNFLDELNVKKKLIKPEKLRMENLQLIPINPVIMIPMKNKHIQVSFQINDKQQ
jgi:hypothetical protein